MSCILRCCMYWLTALDQPLDLCCGAWICPVCRSRSVHENWVQRLPELFSLFHFRCVLQNQILEGACPHYEIGNGACLLEPGFAPRISILRDIGVEKTNKKGKSTHLARQSGYLPRPGYVKHIYSYNAGKEINDRLMEQQLEEQGFYSYNYRQLISKASFFESHSLSGQPPECTGCCDWICQMTNNIHRMRNQRKVFLIQQCSYTCQCRFLCTFISYSYGVCRYCIESTVANKSEIDSTRRLKKRKKNKRNQSGSESQRILP